MARKRATTPSSTRTPARTGDDRSSVGNAMRQQMIADLGATSSMPHASRMGSAFGEGALRPVDVYQSTEAASTLDALGAKAAQCDDTLLLRPGAGPEEVAHELIHVQQGRDGGGSGKRLSDVGDAAEKDAVTLAPAAARGEAVHVPDQPLADVNLWGLPGFLATGAKAAAATTVAAVATVRAVRRGTDVVSTGVPALVEGTGDVLGGAMDGAGAVVDHSLDVAGDGAQWMSEGAGDVVQGTSDVTAAVLDGALDLGGDLIEGGSDLLGDGLELGSKLVGGAVSGASNLVGNGIGFFADLIGVDTDVDDDIRAWGSTTSDAVTHGGSSANRSLDSWGEDTDRMLDLMGDTKAEQIRNVGTRAHDAMDAFGTEADTLLDGLGDAGGDALRDGGQRVRNAFDDASDAVTEWFRPARELFELPVAPSPLYGDIEIPDSTSTFQQQYSEAGLPMTKEAWAMQNAIDGGKLEALYNRSVVRHLVDGGLLDPADTGVDGAPLPTNLADMSDEQIHDLMDLAIATHGSGQSFLDSLHPVLRRDMQHDVITQYIAQANSTPDATFILEMLPTDTSHLADDAIESTVDGLLFGQMPDDFRTGEEVSKARYTSALLAQQTGNSTFALPVPYANVAPNVLLRGGVPTDGAANLANVLALIDEDVQTIGYGYSQGGAALLEALRQQDPDGRTLDLALLLAPMGGADGRGGTGVWSGSMNGTDVLSVVNEEDPAAMLHPEQSWFGFGQAMHNFLKTPPEQEGDGALHSMTCSDLGLDEPFPMACEIPLDSNPTDLQQHGTFGYPTSVTEQLVHDLLDGGAGPHGYQHLGEWDHDLREINACIDLTGVYRPSLVCSSD